MQIYESKQVALWGMALAALLAAAGVGIGLTAAGDEGLVGWGLVAVALLVANFTVLRVRVSKDAVRWSFGIGIFSRRVPLDQVRDVEVRRSPWYWGWGIRWTPRGWLWRSTGLDAVWLHLAKGKQAGVGSEDPESLAEAIRENIPDRAPAHPG